MQVVVKTVKSLSDESTPCLAVGLHEGVKLGSPLKDLDTKLGGPIQSSISMGDFKGRCGEWLLFPGNGRIGPKRVLIMGLGPLKDWNVAALRSAIGRMEERLEALSCPQGAVWMDPLVRKQNLEEVLRHTSETALLAAYRFDKYKSEDGQFKPAPKRLVLLVKQKFSAGRFAKGIGRGLTLARAVNNTRDLISEPSSVVTPAELAQEARRIARRFSLRCEVWDSSKIRRQGFRALAAVGQGSRNTPRFIILEYCPPRARSKPPVVVVGKGITFDSGGISLKPSSGMEMMKYDMSGAAAVLGTLEACAGLKLPQRVVGLIPSAENMPGGTSYKPGDVIKTFSGKTVEINNTDAEGRLVLADALAYAGRFKPRFVVDLATLTGACLVVIGPEAMLAMGNDEGLIQKIRKAGARAGERVWPLPLWDEYLKFMKSDIAQLKNAGGRDAGAITAGIFLKQFVDYPWVHLDIASTAWLERPLPYMKKGARGVGTRLLIELISRLDR